MLRAVVALLMLLLLPSLARAEKRVALVIGNAAYRSMPALRNPGNDAQDIARALREVGFEVILGTDLSRAAMNERLDQFSRAAEGADIAVVYYSGHGMQFSGTNYLLPIEAQLDSASDVNRFRLLPMYDVLETLQSARARVLVLDACRNNPVEDELKRRIASIPGANRDAMMTRGLGRVSMNGLLVAYATQANDVASDGAGRNSPFTAAFIRNVGVPDIDLRTMFFRVQDEVDHETGGRQRPELSISLVGEFKLKVTMTAASATVTAPSVVPTPDPAERAWAVTKDTTSIAIIEDFIRQFESTTYGSLARARLKELQVAASKPPDKPPEKPVDKVAALTPPPGKTFKKPVVNGTRVDWCLLAADGGRSATACGNQAANAWCKRQGMVAALHWKTEKSHTAYRLGDGTGCGNPSAPTCDVFSEVVCR
jgi:hypothetical protein